MPAMKTESGSRKKRPVIAARQSVFFLLLIQAVEAVLGGNDVLRIARGRRRREGRPRAEDGRRPLKVPGAGPVEGHLAITHDRGQELGRQRGGVVKPDIVDAHPIAATGGTVADASKGHDVIRAEADLRVHTGQSELRGCVSHTQLISTDEYLLLDLH